MEASTEVAAPPSLRAHRAELEERLLQAILDSFPLVSYKELRALFRAQYARAVDCWLRAQHSWGTLQGITDTSRQGLQKLGDQKIPSLSGNEVRRLLRIVQEHPEGVGLGAVAGRFFSERGADRGLISFEDALATLKRAGFVEEREGRLHASAPSPGVSTDAVRRILVILQQHAQGLALEALAEAYYGEELGSARDFERALAHLVEQGLVCRERGRYRADPSLDVSTDGIEPELAESIARTTLRIGQRAATLGSGPEVGLYRFTVGVPAGDEEARVDFVHRLQTAVLEVAQAQEGSTSSEVMTVVFGAAPGVL